MLPDTKTVPDVLRDHPFFDGLSDELIELISGCGRFERVAAGEVMFREEGRSDEFYVVLEGRIALQLTASPSKTITLDTVDSGEVIGWSWLIGPHRWRCTAKAVEPTRLITINGACLRGKCENDKELGYDLLLRFSQVLAERLEATRLQLMDIYAND